MKFNLSKAIVVSLLIHGILLSLLVHFSKVPVKVKQEKKPVIQARLFFPLKPKPTVKPEPIQKPEPAQKPALKTVEVEQTKQRINLH